MSREETYILKLYNFIKLICVIPILAFFLTSCGGSSNSNSSLSSIVVTTASGSTSIAKGVGVQLTATGKYSNGSSQALTSGVTWNSNNTNVTVSSTGVVTASTTATVGSTAIITATSGGVSGSITLTVSSATLSSIAITPVGPLNIAVGVTQQFAITGTFSDGTTQSITTGTTWSSSVPSIATISTSGLATAMAIGATVISATSSIATNPNSTNTVTMNVVSFATTWSLQQGINQNYGTALTAAGSQLLAVSESGLNAIAVGANATVLTSTNGGLSWTAQNTGAATTVVFTGVAGLGTPAVPYVIVGAIGATGMQTTAATGAGQVAYISVNGGVSWTPLTTLVPGAGGYLSSVSYNATASQFVIGGASAANTQAVYFLTNNGTSSPVLTLTATLTTGLNSTLGPIASIACSTTAGGNCVAVGMSAATQVSTYFTVSPLTAASTWTGNVLGLSGASAGSNLTSITYNGSAFVIVGNAATATQAAYVSLLGGATAWVAGSGFTGAVAPTLTNVSCSSATQCIASGVNAAGTQVIYTGTINGTASVWAPFTSTSGLTPNIAGANLTAVTGAGTTASPYIAVGAAATNTAFIYTSSNSPTSPTWSSNIGNLSAVTNNGASSPTYVAVGVNGATGANNSQVAYYSTNGSTWTAATGFTATAASTLLDVTYNSAGSLFMAVGLSAAATPLVYTSTSGSSWVSMTSTVFPTTGSSAINGIACSSTICAIVGNTSAASTAFAATSSAASPTSTSWVASTFAPNPAQSLNEVTWSGSQFIAVGNAGSLVTASAPSTVTTAVNWAPQFSSTASNLAGVACSTVTCVAVGATGTIISAPIGSTGIWTTRVSGVSANLTRVTWSATAGLFVVSGSSQTILTSPDGTNWTTRYIGSPVGGTNSQFIGVTGLGNAAAPFNAVGSNGAIALSSS